MPRRKIPAGLQIRSYNPNESSYTGRVNDGEWRNYRVLLERLHSEGVSRAAMLKTLQDAGFHPSIHQLNMKMTEWGLRVYRRHRKPIASTTNAVSEFDISTNRDGDAITLEKICTNEHSPSKAGQSELDADVPPVSEIQEKDIDTALASMGLSDAIGDDLVVPDASISDDVIQILQEETSSDTHLQSTNHSRASSLLSDSDSDFVCPSRDECIDIALSIIDEADISEEQKLDIYSLLGQFLRDCQWKSAAFRFRFAAHKIIRSRRAPVYCDVDQIWNLVLSISSWEDQLAVIAESNLLHEILSNCLAAEPDLLMCVTFTHQLLSTSGISAEPLALQSINQDNSHLLDVKRPNKRKLDSLIPAFARELVFKHWSSNEQELLHVWALANWRYRKDRTQFVLAWCNEKMTSLTDLNLVDIDLDLFPSAKSVPSCFAILQRNLAEMWLAQYSPGLAEEGEDQTKLPSNVVCHESCLTCLKFCFFSIAEICLAAIAGLVDNDLKKAAKLRPGDELFTKFSDLTHGFLSLRDTEPLELHYVLSTMRVFMNLSNIFTGGQSQENDRIDDLGLFAACLAEYSVDLIGERDPVYNTCSFFVDRTANTGFTFDSAESFVSSDSRTTASFRRLVKKARLFATLPFGAKLPKIQFDDTSSHSSWRMSIMSSLRSRKSSMFRFGY